MDCRHDVVRFGEQVVGQVELAALQNVHLDALEDAEAAHSLVQRIDHLPLRADFCGRLTGHGRPR